MLDFQISKMISKEIELVQLPRKWGSLWKSSQNTIPTFPLCFSLCFEQFPWV